jgi:hypothetical protein
MVAPLPVTTPSSLYLFQLFIDIVLGLGGRLGRQPVYLFMSTAPFTWLSCDVVLSRLGLGIWGVTGNEIKDACRA